MQHMAHPHVRARNCVLASALVAMLSWSAAAPEVGAGVRVATGGVGVDAFFQPSTPASISAANLTSLGRLPNFTTDPTLSVLGTTVLVAGVDASSDLQVAAAGSGTPVGAGVVDVSTLTAAGPVASVSRAVVDPVGSVDLAARTPSGHLVLFTSANPTSGLWSATDLTLQAGMAMATTDTPDLVLTPDGTLAVFARASGGDLVELKLDGLAGRSWNLYDLSALSGAGPIHGSPSAVPLPSEPGVEAVYASTPSGGLEAFVDDDRTFTLWSAVPLAVPNHVTLSGGPSVLSLGSSVALAVTSATAHLLVGTSASGLSAPTWTDLSPSLAAVRGSGLVLGTPAVALVGGTLEVAARSTASDLEIIRQSAAGPWVVTDASYLVGTETLIGGNPELASSGSGAIVLALDGGPLPLTSKVVLLAESQDQDHQHILETPLGSNCNPYTGYFGRGSTKGCTGHTASEEWCSDFAQWVWARAGVDTTGITGYSFTFVNWGQAHGTFKPGATNNPRPGDAVVWGYLKSGVGDHVGLVVGVKGKLIDVVSGNAGPPTAQGDNVAVWHQGYFDPSASSAQGGDSIVGYISPLQSTVTSSARHPKPPTPAMTAAIARQDRGR